jgi:hypothetical protein
MRRKCGGEYLELRDEVKGNWRKVHNKEFHNF